MNEKELLGDLEKYKSYYTSSQYRALTKKVSGEQLSGADKVALTRFRHRIENEYASLMRDAEKQREAFELAMKILGVTDPENAVMRSHPTVEDSFRQKCFRMFEKGFVPPDITEMLDLQANGTDYRNVYTYYEQYKKEEVQS